MSLTLFITTLEPVFFVLAGPQKLFCPSLFNPNRMFPNKVI